jgi:hypothetical protein
MGLGYLGSLGGSVIDTGIVISGQWIVSFLKASMTILA